MRKSNEITIEDVRAFENKFAKRKEVGGDAYMSDDDRWKAARFSMNILHKISDNRNASLLDSFEYIQEVNGFENLILPNYDIMHTQDLTSTVYDIEQYIRRKKCHS